MQNNRFFALSPIFAAIAVAAVALFASACSTTDTGKNDAEIERVKKAAAGTWVGQMSELFGGKTIEVTFTASKVSTTGNFSANIKSWNWSGSNMWKSMEPQ